MNLVRTRDGRMIHRADCPQVVRYNFLPWRWADNRSELDIAKAAVYFGYQTCKHCKPVDWSTIQVINNYGGAPVALLKQVEAQ